MGTDKKTDNDHVPSKIALRVEAVERLGEPRPIRVLDAFHGHGRLWDLTREALPEGWDVQLYRSDHQSRKPGTLKIDNARLLEALDLSKFDLIDLDAYGWPTAQLRTVARKAPNTLVLTTRISRPLGQMPLVITRDLGMNLPKGTPPTLILKLGDELWEAWLHHLGYRESRLVRFADPGMMKRYEYLVPNGFVESDYVKPG